MSYSYPIQKVVVGNNIDLAYIQVGEGEQTLVFVHGFASHLPTWEQNFSVLKKYYRCIALDLPGHGFSAKNDYSYSIDFYAQTLKAVFRQTCHQKSGIGGALYGGTNSHYPGFTTP